MDTNPDQKIIEKVVSGDLYAFRELVGKYQQLALRVALRMVGNRMDAEDIVQEAFIRVWKHSASYRKEIKFSTWLCSIVTNRCLDHLKSGQKKREGLTDGWEPYLAVSDGGQADQPLLNEEFHQAVIRMAGVLTPKQRAVFILRDLEELEVDEVCAILSTSAGKVKSNLYYARQKMSALLQDHYGEFKMEKL